MKLIADYRTHTHYSHGTGSIRANIEAAIDRGLDEVAIADHGPASHSIRQFGVQDPETILKIKRKVDKYNRRYPEINVLSAVEANLVDCEGRLDLPQFILAAVDKLLVGFHVFVRPASWRAGREIIVNNLFLEPLNIKRDQIRRRNTELLIKTLRRYDVDIITHPGFKVNIDTPALAAEAAYQKTALEINAKHASELIDFSIAAGQSGVKFCLGSDAHSPEQVGVVGPAIEAAQAAGLEAEDIINVKAEANKSK